MRSRISPSRRPLANAFGVAFLPAIASAKEGGEGGCSMKITEDVRKYAAEPGIAENEALVKGMADKSTEFARGGARVYTSV
jgi:hypothetical protein